MDMLLCSNRRWTERIFLVFLVNYKHRYNKISCNRGIPLESCWEVNTIYDCIRSNSFEKGRKRKSKGKRESRCIKHLWQRVLLLYESCLLFPRICYRRGTAAIVIVVNGFARANHRSNVSELKFNSSPTWTGKLESASRRKHSFSSRMESRSRERGMRRWGCCDRGVKSVLVRKKTGWCEGREREREIE